MKHFALGLLALLLVGCGGSGGSQVESRFSGTYSGDWYESADFLPTPPPVKGHIDVAIDLSGKATGTFSEINPNRSGPLVGRIRNDGVLTFSVDFGPDTIHYIAYGSLNGNLYTGTVGIVGVGYGGFLPTFRLERQP